MMEYTPAWQLFWDASREQSEEPSQQQRSNVVIEELEETEEANNMTVGEASNSNGNREPEIVEMMDGDVTVQTVEGKSVSGRVCTGDGGSVQQEDSEHVLDASDKKNIPDKVKNKVGGGSYTTRGGYKKVWGEEDWVKVTNYADVAGREGGSQITCEEIGGNKVGRGLGEWYDLNVGFDMETGPDEVGLIVGNSGKGKGKVGDNGPDQDAGQKKRCWTETKGADGVRKIYERKKHKKEVAAEKNHTEEGGDGVKEGSISEQKAGAAEQPCLEG